MDFTIKPGTPGNLFLKWWKFQFCFGKMMENSTAQKRFGNIDICNLLASCYDECRFNHLLIIQTAIVTKTQVLCNKL